MFNSKNSSKLLLSLLYNLKKALLNVAEFRIPYFITRNDGSYETHTYNQFFGIMAEDTVR